MVLKVISSIWRCICAFILFLYTNRLRIIKGSLAFLFIYAATGKLRDYQMFTVQIGQSPILIGYASFIAWFIPAIEIVIAILLAFRQTALLGLYASFGLMAMFTAYIVVILNFAERIPCSCGGILDKMGWHEHLIFNIVFTILALWGVLLQSNGNQKNFTRYSLAKEQG